MKDQIDTYFAIHANIEKAYRQRMSFLRRERQGQRSSRLELQYFWFAMIAPSVLAILVAIIGKLVHLTVLFTLSWVLIALSYLALFFYPVVGILLHRDSVKKLFTAPFANLLDTNVRPDMEIDARYLPELLKLDRQVLKLGVLELQSGRNGLAMRTYLVTGMLHKIGIIPGLLALCAGGANALESFAKVGLSMPMNVLFAVAALNFFFFMLSGYVHVQLERHDRMIALSELAIELKADQPAVAGR